MLDQCQMPINANYIFMILISDQQIISSKTISLSKCCMFQTHHYEVLF